MAQPSARHGIFQKWHKWHLCKKKLARVKFSRISDLRIFSGKIENFGNLIGVKDCTAFFCCPSRRRLFLNYLFSLCTWFRLSFVHIKLWWRLRIHFANFQWGIPVLNPHPQSVRFWPKITILWEKWRKAHLCLTANCNGYKQQQGRKGPAPHPVWRYCLKLVSSHCFLHFLHV